MKRLSVVPVILLFALGLCAQGLTPNTSNKKRKTPPEDCSITKKGRHLDEVKGFTKYDYWDCEKDGWVDVVLITDLTSRQAPTKIMFVHSSHLANGLNEQSCEDFRAEYGQQAECPKPLYRARNSPEDKLYRPAYDELNHPGRKRK